MVSRIEQETTVTVNRLEGVAYVWSSDPVHIRAFRKRVANGQAVERSAGEYWAEFTVQADAWSPMTGFKSRRKREYTEAERAAIGERLASARNRP